MILHLQEIFVASAPGAYAIVIIPIPQKLSAVFKQLIRAQISQFIQFTSYAEVSTPQEQPPLGFPATHQPFKNAPASPAPFGEPL